LRHLALLGNPRSFLVHYVHDLTLDLHGVRGYR
jgi:hypothetical protein